MKDKLIYFLTNRKTYIVATIILFTTFSILVYFLNSTKTELNNAYSLLTEKKINTSSLFGIEDTSSKGNTQPTTLKLKANTAGEDYLLEKKLTAVLKDYISTRYTYTDNSDKNVIRNKIKNITTNKLYDNQLSEELADDVFVLYEGNKSKGKLQEAYFMNLDTIEPKAYVDISINSSSLYQGQKTTNNFGQKEYFSFIKENNEWKINSVNIESYDISGDTY